MARDYAGHHAGGKPQAHTGGSRMPGWLWALIGLSVGLCIAAVVFIVYRPMDDAAPAAPGRAPDAAAPRAPDIPPRQEARFKFYDLLPKSEVRPSEEPYRPAPRDEAAASTARYVIQAGSFKQREDAERRKATIALLGVESTILEVEVDGKGRRYRIQIGPAMAYGQAERTMRQLADNDIDSFATRAGG